MAVMEVVKVGQLTGAQPLSRDEIRQRAVEKRESLIDDARALTRALQYLKHARASKGRSGERELTWREAEATLYSGAATRREMCERARKAAA